MNESHQVQDKSPKPQGLLPKNVQSWLLVGLAFLMVAIMWLTGGKKPAAPAKKVSPVTSVEAPLEVNQTKINELQNRIEELQRQQLVAQTRSRSRHVRSELSSRIPNNPSSKMRRRMLLTNEPRI